jgi:hypothetical protein
MGKCMEKCKNNGGIGTSLRAPTGNQIGTHFLAI